MSLLNIKKSIPNFITMLNIVSGFFAIAFAFQGDYLLAFYAIIAASLFDFLDGGVARLLNAQSEVGKQLDSLCDVVSFGVAPGMVMFSLMRDALDLPLILDISTLAISDTLLLLSMALVPAFSALRLAKFNVDTRQSSSFIGLPVPANALFISALGAMMVGISSYGVQNVLTMPIVLVGIAILQSYLLISPLPMFALKFKNLKWKDNSLPFLFLALSLFLILFFHIGGIAMSIVIYVLLSVIIRVLGH